MLKLTEQETEFWKDCAVTSGVEFADECVNELRLRAKHLGAKQMCGVIGCSEVAEYWDEEPRCEGCRAKELKFSCKDCRWDGVDTMESILACTVCEVRVS